MATDDDRATADRIITTDAEPTRTQLAALPSPDELDVVPVREGRWDQQRRLGECRTITATIRASGDHVDAARALIRIRGGEAKVDPVIVRIAHAEVAQSNGKRAADRRAS